MSVSSLANATVCFLVILLHSLFVLLVYYSTCMDRTIIIQPAAFKAEQTETSKLKKKILKLLKSQIKLHPEMKSKAEVSSFVVSFCFLI